MTWKPRIEDASKPKYLAIVDALSADISAGRLEDGERLPTQRDIAAELGVTIQTVTRALGEASRRGLVSARIGSGTFVRKDASLTATPTHAIDLSLNTVPSGPAKPYLDDALAEIGGRHASEDFLAYQPAIGSDRHRRVIASWFAPRLPKSDTTEISLCHGAQHALSACFGALVRPGEAVLCEAWTYTGIRRLAAGGNARLVGVDVDADGLVPAALAAAFERTGARVLVCSATVQNPTTTSMPVERRSEIIKITRRHDAVIVEDDIYGMLSDDRSDSLARMAPDDVVYVSSVSKCTMPGIRLGLISSPGRLTAGIRDKLISLQWTAPSFFAELVSILVESGGADACVSAHQTEMASRLGIVSTYLPGFRRPRHLSYHIWLPIPDGWRLDETVAALLERGVRVSPSTHFRVNDEPAPYSRLRVCLGSIEDRSPLPEAIRTIQANWSGQPRLAATIV